MLKKIREQLSYPDGMKGFIEQIKQEHGAVVADLERRGFVLADMLPIVMPLVLNAAVKLEKELEVKPE